METRGSWTDRERGIDDGKVDQLCIESTSSTRYYGGQTKYRGVTGHGIPCSGSRSRKTRPSARANNDGEASIVLQVIESSLPSDACSTRSLLLHLFASPVPFFPSIPSLLQAPSSLRFLLFLSAFLASRSLSLLPPLTKISRNLLTSRTRFLEKIGAFRFYVLRPPLWLLLGFLLYLLVGFLRAYSLGWRERKG